MLGALAGGAVAAVVVGEVGRVWRRGSAPLPGEAPSLLLAAEEAVAETAEVARAGYREVSTRENAMFNLLDVVRRHLHRGTRHHATCCGTAPGWGHFATCAWVGATSTTSCPGS